MSGLKAWAGEAIEKLDRVSSEGEIHTLLNHIIRVLCQEDSCRWVEDGYLGLGLSTCREGDVLYAILGCRRLMLLRKEDGNIGYRIIGKFDPTRAIWTLKHFSVSFHHNGKQRTGTE